MANRHWKGLKENWGDGWIKKPNYDVNKSASSWARAWELLALSGPNVSPPNVLRSAIESTFPVFPFFKILFTSRDASLNDCMRQVLLSAARVDRCVARPLVHYKKVLRAGRPSAPRLLRARRTSDFRARAFFQAPVWSRYSPRLDRSPRPAADSL